MSRMVREFHLGRLRYHSILVSALVFCLLSPALLCAIPAAPMSGGDCCEHMTSETCHTANMSSCCETTVPGVALTAIVAKVTNALSAPMINAIHWSMWLPERTVAFQSSVHDPSPPGLESMHS